jgi:hypothetical protein
MLGDSEAPMANRILSPAEKQKIAEEAWDAYSRANPREKVLNVWVDNEIKADGNAHVRIITEKGEFDA